MAGKRMAVVLGAGLGIAACSGDVMDIAGDAMVVVGDALQRPDAHAATFDLTCEEEVYERVVALSDGSRSVQRTTRWVANVSDPSIDPLTISRATTVLCGADIANEIEPSNECPSGATCTGETAPSAGLDCIVGTASVEPGRAQVWCGQETMQTNTNAAGTVTLRMRIRSRWTRARLVID